MAIRIPATSFALWCGILANHATAALPAFADVAVQHHSFRHYPDYPDEYQDSGRVGEVLSRCDALPDLRVSNCRVVAVEGGEAFGRAVLAWLSAPDFRATPLPPNTQVLHPGSRDFFNQFSVGSTAFSTMPISGSRPALPSAYHGPRKGELADCAIAADGRPNDCKIVEPEQGDPLAAPALSWLGSGQARYKTVSTEHAGARHLVSVPFALSPSTQP